MMMRHHRRQWLRLALLKRSAVVSLRGNPSAGSAGLASGASAAGRTSNGGALSATAGCLLKPVGVLPVALGAPRLYEQQDVISCA